MIRKWRVTVQWFSRQRHIRSRQGLLRYCRCCFSHSSVNTRKTRRRQCTQQYRLPISHLAYRCSSSAPNWSCCRVTQGSRLHSKQSSMDSTDGSRRRQKRRLGRQGRQGEAELASIRACVPNPDGWGLDGQRILACSTCKGDTVRPFLIPSTVLLLLYEIADLPVHLRILLSTSG